MLERDADMNGLHSSPSSALLEAAAHDLAGRHSDAVAVLSRAASAGDLVAKRTVGLRILLGDRAPYLGPEGVQLLAEAASEGDAAAADVSAVLAGAGIHRPQNWTHALEWSRLAAELGSERARGALGVLCSDLHLASLAQQAEPAVSLWGQLRDTIDLARWLTPPVARELLHDPLIRTYPHFADGRMCRWLMAYAHRRLARAKVYNPSTRMAEDAPERTNAVAHANLVDTDLSQVLLQARIAAAVGLPFANFEPLAVLHYSAGQEFFDHYDFVDPDDPGSADDWARNGQRPYTFLLYLNADYEGGETSFPRLDLGYRGEVGEALLLRNVRPTGEPDLRTLHAGRPPRSGQKWILSQFVRDRPIVPGTSG